MYPSPPLPSGLMYSADSSRMKLRLVHWPSLRHSALGRCAAAAEVCALLPTHPLTSVCLQLRSTPPLDVDGCAPAQRTPKPAHTYLWTRKHGLLVSVFPPPPPKTHALRRRSTALQPVHHHHPLPTVQALWTSALDERERWEGHSLVPCRPPPFSLFLLAWGEGGRHLAVPGGWCP